MKEFDENKIDDFLLGRMDEKEIVEFKNKLSMDAEFSEQVRQRRKALEYIDILGDLALKKRIQRLHPELVDSLPTEKRFKVRTLLKYAAVVVFLLCAGYWFLQGPPSSVEIFNNYYQAYELNFAERGGNAGETIIKGGQHYRAGNYQQALDQFNTLPDEAISAKITLARGICFLENDQFSNAGTAFQSLIDNKDPIYEQHARWYLAMTYLKAGEREAAILLLRQIAESNEHYNQAEAQEILEKIDD